MSLQVLGAQLFKKQLGYWESQWRKISASVLPAEIQSRLKIGYDDLDDQEKEVFLDTQAKFVDRNKSSTYSHTLPRGKVREMPERFDQLF